MALPPGVFGDLTPRQLHRNIKHILHGMREGTLQFIASGDVAVETKPGYDGTPGADVVTAADRFAQGVFMGMRADLLPGLGVIAEEGELHVECTLPGEPVVITVDPIDGSRQLKRLLEDPSLPRDGVAIMIGVRVGDRVVGAYILDLFKGDLLALNPATGMVTYHIFGRGVPRVVQPFSWAPAGWLNTGTLLMGDNQTPATHGPLLQMLTRPVDQGGAFGKVVPIGHSFALTLPAMIKEEAVGAVRRNPGFSTPWDDTPMIGICNALGIDTYYVLDHLLQEFVAVAPNAVIPRHAGVLYLPRCYVQDLGGSVRHLP